MGYGQAQGQVRERSLPLALSLIFYLRGPSQDGKIRLTALR